MSGDNPLGLALIGCGEVTLAKHLPALRLVRGVRVAAVADLDRTRSESAASAFSISNAVAGIEDILKLEGVDAVGVAVPPASHAAIAVTALRAGKHVWIDKPLALNVEDCLRIVEEAARNNVTVMTGFHMRHHRLVQQARAVVESGRLGRIESIRSTWNSPRNDHNLPEWRLRRETGGGALVEIGVHHFDLWRFLLGKEVIRVSAAGRDGERDDENAVVSAEMEDGVLACAILSERTGHEIEFEICGDKGRLRASCLRFEGLDVRSVDDRPGGAGVRLRRGAHFLASLPAGVVSMARGGEYRESYRAAWQRFVDAARGGADCGCGPVEGLRAVEISLAAVESRMRGVWVGVPRHLGEPRASVAEPLFSVVVPTFNRPAQLGNLMESLRRQTLPRDQFETVIVDDGGSADLKPLVERFRHDLNVTLARIDHAGCAAARQAGVEAARGRWLVFTDDDCRPASDWLEQYAHRIEGDPDAALGGPVKNGLPESLFSEASEHLAGYLDRRFNANTCRYFPSNNLALPARALSEIGGMPADWPIAGGEDRELCARWLRSGRRITRADHSRVFHHHQLGPVSYFRQHFNYGRGAHRYRARLASTGEPSPPLERWKFYVALVFSPLPRYRWKEALPLCGLMALAQAASALGYLWDWTCSYLQPIGALFGFRQKAKL